MDNMIELFFIGGFYLILVVIAFIAAILRIFLFMRAGEAGWKAIIPFYGSFTYHKLTFGEENKWFWFITIVAGAIYSAYTDFCFARAFGRSKGFATVAIFFPTICALIILISGDEYDGPRDHFLGQA